MTPQSSTNRFVMKRSDLNTLKLFVEFYLPEHQHLLNKLHQGPYDVLPLHRICTRMFDGPFGSDRKVDMYQSSGIPYIRVKDVLPEGIALDDLMYISAEKHADLARSKVIAGNVLMTIAGRVGTAAVFPKELREGNITGHIVGFELPDDINPHYVALFLNSYLGEFQVQRWSHRTTRPELNLFEVGQIEVAIPPRPIQNCIAQVMQDAYAARRAKLAEAEALLDQIEETVLRVLGISSESPNETKRFRIKQTEIHRWDVRYFLPVYQQLEQNIQQGKFKAQALLNLCTKLTNGLTPPRSGYKEDGCAVIKVASLTRDFRINWSKFAYTGEDFFRKAQKAHVEPDDLLILSAAHQLDYIGHGFGLVLEMPEELHGKCMAVGELIIARVDQQKILPNYLLACFATNPFQELINRMTRGQSAHLYSEDLGKLQIPVPPIQVQQTIADEITHRRATARRLRTAAESVVAEAKARVERMILGEEAP